MRKCKHSQALDNMHNPISSTEMQVKQDNLSTSDGQLLRTTESNIVEDEIETGHLIYS